MKLIIKRQTDVNGFFLGHKCVTYSLSAIVNITQEDRCLIDSYKAGNYTIVGLHDLLYDLYVTEAHNTFDKINTEITFNDLVGGKQLTVNDIERLLKLEEKIRTWLQKFKDRLMAMKTSQGEEVFEI